MIEMKLESINKTFTILTDDDKNRRGDKPWEESDSVFMMPTHGGFGLTSAFLGKHPYPTVYQAVHYMDRSHEAAHILLVDKSVSPPKPRAVVIQSSNSSFYINIHGDQIYKSRIWRDYFYSVSFVAFKTMEERWGDCETIVLDHLVSFCNWPTGLLACSLEALKNYALINPQTSIKTIIIDHGQNDLQVQEAINQIDKRLDHRDIHFEIKLPNRKREPEVAQLYRIDIPVNKKISQRERELMDNLIKAAVEAAEILSIVVD